MPFKAARQVLRLRPSTIWVSLLVGAAALALGCWGVLWGAHHDAAHSRERAAALTSSFASSLRLVLQTQLVEPVKQVKDAILLTDPSSWQRSAPHLATIVGDIAVTQYWTASVAGLSVSPQGLVMMYAARNPTNTNNTTVVAYAPSLDVDEMSHPELGLIGYDVLEGNPRSRQVLLEAIRVRGPIVMGPIMNDPRVVANGRTVLFSVVIPVFVRPSNASQQQSEWVPKDIPRKYNCSECAAIYDGAMWWGFVVGGMLLDFGPADSSNSGRNNTTSLISLPGYRFRLDVPNLDPTAPPNSSSYGTPRTITSSQELPTDDAVVTSFHVDQTNAKWTLYVSPDGGSWTPKWKWPTFAAVIAVSVCLGVVTFMSLLALRVYDVMLHTLLPPHVVKQIRKSNEYAMPTPQNMDSEIPAEMMLRVTTCVLNGEQPAIRDLTGVRSALLRRCDLFMPLNYSALLRGQHFESDVKRSLLMQLVGRTTNNPRMGPLLDTFETVWNNELTQAEPLDTTQTGIPMPTPTPTVVAPSVPSLVGTDEDDARESAQLPAHGPALNLLNPTAAVHVAPRMLDETESLLAHAGTFNKLDVHALAKATGGRPLSCLGFFILRSTGLMEHFKLDSACLLNYLTHVEDMYQDNPYHNATHAAHVLHNVHAILAATRRLHGCASKQLVQLAMYLAAATHDVGHPGLTNDYLITSSNEIAICYNDVSPLENHHAATAFRIMQQPGMRLLDGMPSDDRVALRKVMIALVMATDMKQHFSFVTRYKAFAELNSASTSASSIADCALGKTGMKKRTTGDGRCPQEFAHELELQQPAKASMAGGTASMASATYSPMVQPAMGDSAPATSKARGGGCTEREGGASRAREVESRMKDLRALADAEKLLTLQMAIKCADLGHLAAPWPVHLQWVRDIEEEFFQQGDAEKTSGLPISPLCDRSQRGITKSQVGFFDVVVLPLFRTFTSTMPGTAPLLVEAEANYMRWSQNEAPTAHIELSV